MQLSDQNFLSLQNQFFGITFPGCVKTNQQLGFIKPKKDTDDDTYHTDMGKSC